MNKKAKVVHITTVHSWQDPRIFLKECRSLAKNGYEVHLITPDGIDEIRDGVHIHKLKYQPANRFLRFLKAPANIFEQALSLEPNIIHFHDPELIPAALKINNKNDAVSVIHDIHEDNITAIEQREYLPAFIKPLVKKVVQYYENRASKELYTIIAEKYYEKRFPEAVPILNYLDLGWIEEKNFEEERYPGIIYTGNVREERGALNHAKILSYTEDVELWNIGRCTSALYHKMETAAGSGKDRLIVEGLDEYVPFNTIIEKYKSRNWLAGLAIFPYSEHVKEKQLTKFFEYMAAGIPIIYSNFKAWRELLDPLDVGIAVDPDNEKEIDNAVKLLKSDHDLWKRKSLNGQNKVDHFSWDEEENVLINFYESL